MFYFVEGFLSHTEDLFLFLFSLISVPPTYFFLLLLLLLV